MWRRSNIQWRSFGYRWPHCDPLTWSLTGRSCSCGSLYLCCCRTPGETSCGTSGWETGIMRYDHRCSGTHHHSSSKASGPRRCRRLKKTSHSAWYFTQESWDLLQETLRIIHINVTTTGEERMQTICSLCVAAIIQQWSVDTAAPAERVWGGDLCMMICFYSVSFSHMR